MSPFPNIGVGRAIAVLACLILCVQVAACANKRSPDRSPAKTVHVIRPRPQAAPPFVPPDDFDVNVRVRSHRIASHRVMDEAKVGPMRFTRGRVYSTPERDGILVELIPLPREKYPFVYWVEVPSMRDGSLTVTAAKRLLPCPMGRPGEGCRDITHPPQQLTLWVDVKVVFSQGVRKRIPSGMRIASESPPVPALELDRYEPTDDGVLGVFRSPMYPSHEWRGFMPPDEGRYRVILKLRVRPIS